MSNVEDFKVLAAKAIDEQLEFFLKSFIFELDDDWKEVVQLSTKFKEYVQNSGEDFDDLNPAAAADFLQKNGKTRTALQRKAEINDIDLDNNDRIAFIEYLLLHYKVMVLKAYYKRTGESPKQPLNKTGIGIVGVGGELLDELYTMPTGLDPALEKAIEEFTAKKRERETKIKTLKEKASAGGVKGLTAKNELAQMETQDTTEMSRMELTLNAAKKKSATKGGDEALKEKQKAKEEEEKAKKEAGRSRLKNMAALWENQ